MGLEIVGELIRSFVDDRRGALARKLLLHIRTPQYVRHKTGTVIQYCGTFLNPEDLARGNTAGPAVENYRVAFRQKDLWPGYEGPDSDSLVLEIYHHWLAPEA